MRRWLTVLALLAGGCGDGSGEAPPEAVSFRWVTTVVQDGSGYELVVEGAVGDDHAGYELAVESTADGGIGVVAAEAVGGVAGGRTQVRVLGGFRWYRNPWLIDEAAGEMGDDEWVLVASERSVVADVATAVLNERYDQALRRLLGAVGADRPIQAPTTAEQDSELDEILTPWVGLAGPGNPLGSQATVTGDAAGGEASWRQVLTVEEDGVDGELRGHVTWETVPSDRPRAPTDVIDVDELTAVLDG